ncbi:FtsK/SpoIIIE domain-containing protein [Geodermatophilus ruber]|uniref:DNA segregation ATPase FtsK/SpoIIIE, S-DNA-T family n=1 Tax=Geodermatophilus ruber TaxID=504800 RepID=A0A1I4JJE9_9ACTN|nr:FtsK/SpoIIIE domain-containing protein [Geodermatophilus ruber]SFL66680.1 DNA segregation ATPase FtsK/SpoIIIE, S-DNA-T family [Geodermatophilus ruber]
MHPRSGAVPHPRRCWTVVTAPRTVDVEVAARDDATLGSVLPVLATALGSAATDLWSGSTRLSGEMRLDDPALAHGAVLGWGRPAPRRRADGASALELHVLGGPDAGTVLPLGTGRHVIGRGAEADVELDDPDVSRRHALVEVGAGGITVRDLGSTNGSRLDGAELGTIPREWPAGAVLRLGTSALATSGPAGISAVARPAPGGRLSLRPPPRMVAGRTEVEVRFPAAPAPPPRRRLAWVAVALPAVAGVTMAWLLGSPHFLFFALLSPVVAVGTWLSDRWSGRRTGRRTAAEHAAALREAQTRVTDAVRADVRAREAASPDLAAVGTAARRRSVAVWQRRRGDADVLAVRVGTGPGVSSVTRVAADGGRAREPADHLPVAVELAATGGLGVTGPRSLAVGVLAGVVAQLTALHAPGDVDLVLVTTAERLPDWAWLRWLPHVAPGNVHPLPVAPDAAASSEAALARLRALLAARRTTGERHPGQDGGPGWLVVVVDGPEDPRLLAALREARPAGVIALAPGASPERLPVAVDAVLTLAGETGGTATLTRAGAADQPDIVVDRLPARVADSLARDLAALTPEVVGAALPRRVRLLELPASGTHIGPDGTAAGAWSRSRTSLVATLGRTTDGTAEIDLVRHGPHALVAGTTGAGKSELLQTLIAGLALRHPPDRCSFLLVDYKGGAAFAEAAGLPHTVGLLTDLDGATTARALRSLTAELTRREALLAAHGAPDLGALPDTVELARLVIVVDEFAGLTEELPSFVSGLVGIAQRGRSLGVHLVLATQRPSGVVSPEIRANCTLRICLRTTDEADSRDVLGTPHAAFLPTDVPGRAYLRAGSGGPVPLQVARVAGSPPVERERAPQVRPWRWPHPPEPASSTPPRPGTTDLARLTAALARRAEEERIPRPHRPWRPALPDRIRAEDLARATPPGPEAGGRADAGGRLTLGLLDRPDTQSQEPLALDLARGGGWLAVGGARSGRTTFLRTALAEAVTAVPPDRLHVHVLDHGGGALATAAAPLPHTGTVVGSDDPLRTVRLLDRLAQEVTARRAGTRTDRPPSLLLLVDGVEALCTQLDEVDPGRGSAALLRLVREGAAAGLTCLLTADRAVPGGRLANAVDRRLVLPLPDRADYAIAGVPAGLVPGHRPPGRALVGEHARECQLALPRPLTAVSSPLEGTVGRARPLTIPELPPDPALPLPRSTPRSSLPSRALHLPLGPGGDDGSVLEVDLSRAGGLLVVGPPGSGRSTALGSFARHLAALGVPVCRLVRSLPPPAAGDDASATTWLTGADVVGWQAWLAARAGGPAVVVADDHGALTESPVLTAGSAGEPPDDLLFLVAGTAAELAGAYRGPVSALRRRRSGLLLCPGPVDADLLGIRLPRTPVPTRPGSGWLVTGGVPQRVQVARRQATPAPQGDRSAAPVR